MKRNHKGYTLVETVVICAIVAILLGAATLGIVQYTRYTNFKRQNEYAQSLFTAAQMQLTAYSQLGQLAPCQQATEENHAVPLDALRFDDDLTVSAAGIWGTDQKAYQGVIRFIQATAEDYQAYCAGTLTDPAKKALYDLFDSYLYNKSILNATICLEFDPYEGLVYSVLYSDLADDFTYGSDTSDAVSIANRASDARKDRMVGYYGVETLSKSTSTEAEKPVISNVMLNNQETLNLSFRLRKVPEAVSQLTYEAIVYDAESKQPLLSISFNNPDKAAENGALVALTTKTGTLTIHAKVIRYNAQGDRDEASAQTYVFPAWVEEDGTVRLVLDAVDLGATADEYLKDPTFPNLLQNSFSLHRFGISANMVYCTIQGSAPNYKTTAKKESNAQQPYFGSYTAASSLTSRVYSLYNARHLYNMRFSEGEAAATPTTYNLAADISWSQLIASGSVYKKQAEVKSANGLSWIENSSRNNAQFSNSDLLVSNSAQPFVAMAQLKADSILQSVNRAYTIRDLVLSPAANQEDGVLLPASAGSAEQANGLFLLNAGIIRRVNFDRVQVSGTHSVGVVCGINAGAIGSVTVSAACTSAGQVNVGGIAGRQLAAAGNAAPFSSVTNRAAVTGVQNVGGIVGQISASVTSFAVQSCKNYGQVRGVAASGLATQNIGGIAGYAEQNASATLVFSGCTSSPHYTDDELFSADRTALRETLTGRYVGGIIGYNNGATLTACNTLEENGQPGYVLGDTFVGGIVGYNAGNMIEGSNNRNQANVIGNTYVGGITGANAALNNKGEISSNSNQSKDRTIRAWLNEGMIVAFNHYAGGIAGYNAGSILNCGCDIDYNERTRLLANLNNESCDFVGGLAGYNGGSVTSDGNRTVVSVVTGRNYIGGIVGYNDADATIQNYELQGGYVFGRVFAGGFVGLNLAPALVSGRAIQANANLVSGQYCVGGILGGNIIDSKDDLITTFNAYNILGNITGKAFVGGFIGYNIMTLNENWSANKITDAIINRLSDSLANNIDLLDNLSKSNGAKSVLTIQGESVELRGISADVYVSGVIGYNDPSTYLYIKNVINKTPITARQTVRRNESGIWASFAYAGAIIGKVNDSVIVDQCANAGLGSVSSDATYTGGIAEVNTGLIVRCTAANGGTNTTDRIGGITGLNISSFHPVPFGSNQYADAHFGNEAFAADKNNSIWLGVFNCTFSGTLNGRGTVGGIAAENWGRIVNPEIKDGKISAYGENVGGIVGINQATGSLQLSATQDIQIEGSGTKVGGVIGTNYGTLTVEPGSAAEALTVGSGKSITGQKSVGGIVGEQRADLLSGCSNGASVTAYNGGAGGIVGVLSKGEISSCNNFGSVQATLSGDAGGILSDLSADGTVQNCWNSADIVAANGICGGITATNDGTILTCEVASVRSKTEEKPGFWENLLQTLFPGLFPGANPVQITGNQVAGGLTGRNAGTMTGCIIRDITVSNSSSSADNGKIGGMVGENQTQGTIQLSGSCVQQTAVRTYTNGCSVGGVAGSNTGSITGTNNCTIGSSISDVLVAFSGSAAVYGNFGGVVGWNAEKAIVTGCAVKGSITGDQGTSATPENGYGGVAGVNAGSISESSFDGTVYSNGTVSSVSPTGGICGKNLAAGSVVHCWIGVREDTSILVGRSNAAYGYLGGLVGWNQGAVLGCDNQEKSKAASVTITGYAGHVGGIAGFNDETGRVTADESGTSTILLTSGSNWLVNAKYYSNDCGTGGILGYSSSGYDLRYVKNYAEVRNSSGQSSNSAVGGIIGRLENKLRYNFRISYCENHGKVWSNALSGGFIGRWKYLGGTIEYSVNDAAIGYDPSGKKNCPFSSGFIASTYAITGGSQLNLRFCQNYGDVVGTSTVCGMVWVANASAGSFPLSVSDCVNTGVLNGSKAAGFAVIDLNCSAQFYGCRNYGLFKGASNYAGICYGSNNTMRECFDYSNAPQPFANVKLSICQNNYYLNYSGSGRTSTLGKALAVTQNTDATYAIAASDQSGPFVSHMTQNPGGTGSGINNSESPASGLSFVQDFSPYSGASASFRYQVIDAIEKGLAETYPILYYGEASSLSGLKATAGGGYYTIAWADKTVPCYGYEVSYQVKDQDTVLAAGTYICAKTSLLLDVEPAWSGKKLTVSVKGIYWINGTKTTTQALSVTETIKRILPTPQVHLELTGTENSSYIAVLDNLQDYQNLAGIALKDITIMVSSSAITGSPIRFTAENGHSAAFSLKTAGNATFSAYAELKTESDYSDSVTRTVQSKVFPVSTLQSTDKCKTTFNGFYGQQLGKLNYNLTVQKTDNNIEAYYYSEILAYNETIGAYVAMSYGESHVTDQGSPTTAVLSGLDPTFLRSDSDHPILVRTYPWRTQTYMVYYGHEVSASVSADELRTVQDAGQSIWSASGELKVGYVLQSNGDGTYRVIYSTILANSSSYSVQIDQREYKVEDGKLTGNNSSITIQSEPVIEADCRYTAQEDRYRFVWDRGSADSKASYAVRLIGIAADQTEVELINTSTETANTSIRYDAASKFWYLDVTDDNWNYPDVRLEVERLGTANSKGQTTAFPAQSRRTFNLKVRLSQISVPAVSFYEGINQIVEKNNLIYTVSWAGLTAAAEQNDLYEYEVMVQYTNAAGNPAELVFRTSQRVATVQEALSGMNPAIYAESNTATSAVLNLNTLAVYGGSEMRVSVRAIAREDATVYRNGMVGVPRALTIPRRLALPLLINLKFTSDPVVSVDAFEQTGFVFQMAQNYTEKGSYQMAAEIVQKQSDDSYTPVANLTDGSGQVIDERNPLLMTGNLNNSTLTLTGLSAKYAGLYLKTALRAIGDSSISSLWTSTNDPVNGFAYFRLPRVRVDAPLLTEGMQTVIYKHHSEYEADWEKIDQKTLSFQPVSYANQYTIRIVRALHEVDLVADVNHQAAEVLQIRLEQSGTGYRVFCTVTDHAQYGAGAEVELGTLTADTPLDLPYVVTLGEGENQIDMTAQLQLSAGDNTITLLLPDFDHTDPNVTDPTRSVTMQAMPSDPAHYEPSLLSGWHRTTVNGTDTTYLTDGVATPAAPKLTANDFTVLPAAKDGEFCRISVSDQPDRLLVALSDGTQTRLYSMPAVASTGSSVSSLLALDQATWASDAGKTVTLRVCAVVEGKGLSDWSDPITITLPQNP